MSPCATCCVTRSTRTRHRSDRMPRKSGETYPTSLTGRRSIRSPRWWSRTMQWASPRALLQLVDVAVNSESDALWIKAASLVLDRGWGEVGSEAEQARRQPPPAPDPKPVNPQSASVSLAAFREALRLNGHPAADSGSTSALRPRVRRSYSCPGDRLLADGEFRQRQRPEGTPSSCSRTAVRG